MGYFDISSFFKNSSSTSGLGSINLSDYSLIKSGSYKKLMKSYYGGAADTSTSKTDTTTNKKKPTISTTDTTGLTKMKTEADELKSSIDAFDKDNLWKQSNGQYDTEKISSAVKKYVNEYNDVLAQSSKVTNKDVSQQTGYMTSMTRTMSSALSKVGIKIAEDGKLSIDEDTFNKADMKSVKSLFSGSYSYASQIKNNASAIGSAALRNQSTYTSSGNISSTISSMYNDYV